MIISENMIKSIGVAFHIDETVAYESYQHQATFVSHC